MESHGHNSQYIRFHKDNYVEYHAELTNSSRCQLRQANILQTLCVQLLSEVGNFALQTVNPLYNDKSLATNQRSLGMSPQWTSHPTLGDTTNTTLKIITDAHLAAGLSQTSEPIHQSAQPPKGILRAHRRSDQQHRIDNDGRISGGGLNR